MTWIHVSVLKKKKKQANKNGDVMRFNRFWCSKYENIGILYESQHLIIRDLLNGFLIYTRTCTYWVKKGNVSLSVRKTHLQRVLFMNGYAFYKPLQWLKVYIRIHLISFELTFLNTIINNVKQFFLQFLWL